MKTTKSKLARIIKEEFTRVVAEGDAYSRQITDVEKIGDLINQASRISEDQAVIDLLQQADDLVSKHFMDMQGVTQEGLSPEQSKDMDKDKDGDIDKKDLSSLRKEKK